jgi:hypothetical protein
LEAESIEIRDPGFFEYVVDPDELETVEMTMDGPAPDDGDTACSPRVTSPATVEEREQSADTYCNEVEGCLPIVAQNDDEPLDIPLPVDDEDKELARYEAMTKPQRIGVFQPPPSISEARSARDHLDAILNPPSLTSRYRRSKKENVMSPLLRERLQLMSHFLNTYTELAESQPGATGHWSKAADLVGIVYAKPRKVGRPKPKKVGTSLARNLKAWTQAFIADREVLPYANQKGGAGRSLLEDEDLCQEISVHLQSKGKYIRALDIVHFLATPDVMARLKRTKTIGLTTARRWLQRMGYRWAREPSGQYVDGHEREDVVNYRNHVFLPALLSRVNHQRIWDANCTTELLPAPITGRQVVFWFHDESTFYAHDRRKVRWIHSSETAKPHAKGEGHSLMVADFVSADYGWLNSPDGTESARVLFRAGKNREGYFYNQDILEQAEKAFQIVCKWYPDEDHVFVYDNATTHSKRAADAVSATKMTKGPSANFGPTTSLLGPDRKPVYGPDGKVVKIKIKMANGKLPNGSEQSFYFPDNHETYPGYFKGMVNILAECGIDCSGKRTQCGSSLSHCPPGAQDCCCRQILYRQPDFSEAESLLETLARSYQVETLFLPKFHCELNPIEQCWGFSKRRYRLNPPSSSEDDLEHNVVEALESIPLVTIRKFFRRAFRFMDTYSKKLDGKWAAWAVKKYWGHRMLPETIMDEIEALDEYYL